MSSPSSDNPSGKRSPAAKSESTTDVRACKECDVFGEDRCSMHGGTTSSVASEQGYTRLKSKYAGTCRVCRKAFEKDDIIYWAPERKPMCSVCGQSGDGGEGSLDAAAKEKMTALLETLSSLERLPKPWDEEAQDKFETTLASLYGQFRGIARVSSYLDRHMDELKSIPARRGMLHSRPLISKRPDHCRICHKRTETGDLIWWSASEPLMCFDCGRGKDAVEAALAPEERARMEALLKRGQEFELFEKPWTPEQVCEYDALLVSLYSRFRAVAKVKRVLLKHIDGLKDIARRKGPGDKRTVIARQESQCRSCNRAIDKGDVVWWAPDSQRLCFDCGSLAQEESFDDAEQQRARELLERLVQLDTQSAADLPAAWASKLLDEREDVLIELYCDFRHLDEVRKRLYENFHELCAIAGKASG